MRLNGHDLGVAWCEPLRLETTGHLRDGRNTLEEMAAAAERLGYEYLAITDHSASHGFGNHVTADQLWQRIDEVKAFNDAEKKSKGRIRLLAGSEVNIGLDGSLDYLHLFHRLGLRVLQLTYQRRNLVGDGCGETTTKTFWRPSTG